MRLGTLGSVALVANVCGAPFFHKYPSTGSLVPAPRHSDTSRCRRSKYHMPELSLQGVRVNGKPRERIAFTVRVSRMIDFVQQENAGDFDPPIPSSTLNASSMLPGLRACTRFPSWRHTLSNTFLALRNPTSFFHTSSPLFLTLNQAIRRKAPQVKKRPRAPLLQQNPFKKGVVNQIFIAKPKKPNSAKRKVAKVTLSNGETVQAYIQGEGHNLQEHSVVLVRGGRAQDLPGVRCAFCFVGVGSGVE